MRHGGRQGRAGSMGGSGHIRDEQDAGEVEIAGVAQFGDPAHCGHGHHRATIDGSTNVIAVALNGPGAFEQVVVR